MSRAEERGAFDDHTRIVLLEHDADEREDESRWILRLFVGLLITLCVTALALAANLAVG